MTREEAIKKLTEIVVEIDKECWSEACDALNAQEKEYIHLGDMVAYAWANKILDAIEEFIGG